MSKYIFVTGGVCSSLGKGIASSSLGSLLESRGLRVCMIKVDPYINVDAGTMSPFQHGEVYVTEDGAETDLDLGNYARFTNSELTRQHSITTGQIYESVIKMEREGKYLGKCVQVVPHITNEIKRRIFVLGEQPEIDVTIVEIGGTVGDIESIPFLEAVRQIMHERGSFNAISAHVTLLPTLPGGEMKTKPTQHSVKAMREIGIQPQVLLCRCATPLDEDQKRKIAMFTNIDFDGVLSAHDVNTTLYDVPLNYHKEGLDSVVCQRLRLIPRKADLKGWKNISSSYRKATRTVTIAMVGKYVSLDDAYKSVDEALLHGALENNVRLKLLKFEAEEIEENKKLKDIFAEVDGFLIPGGFGRRGILGMIQTAKYARENNIPILGICLGMQVMVIEFARNVCGLTGADSTEFSSRTPHPVISMLEEQVEITNYGGTMRLGKSQVFLNDNTKTKAAYQTEEISERHRHRYEISFKYREKLEKAGLVVGAASQYHAGSERGRAIQLMAPFWTP